MFYISPRLLIVCDQTVFETLKAPSSCNFLLELRLFLSVDPLQP